MGQHYAVVNIDKREYFNAHDFGCELELMSWATKTNQCNLALLNLMADRWKGDRVYVVGNLAQADDISDPCYPTLDAINKELHIKGMQGYYVNKGVTQVFNVSLYDVVDESFTHINEFPEEKHIHYIYNTKTKQFLCLEHANAIRAEAKIINNRVKVSIPQYASLALLLTMGNGRGEGDYYPSDTETESLVGSWCQYSQDLVLSPSYIIDYWNYTEFEPNFHEGLEAISESKIYTIRAILEKECLHQLHLGVGADKVNVKLNTLQEIRDCGRIHRFRNL